MIYIAFLKITILEDSSKTHQASHLTIYHNRRLLKQHDPEFYTNKANKETKHQCSRIVFSDGCNVDYSQDSHYNIQ